MELIQDNVKVELEDIGEGLSGEYSVEDPCDMPLLRFYVSVMTNPETGDRMTREELKANPKLAENAQWDEVDDASYCTQLPVESSEEEQQAALLVLMNRFQSVLADDPYASVKKVGEEMSWISKNDLKRTA